MFSKKCGNRNSGLFMKQNIGSEVNFGPKRILTFGYLIENAYLTVHLDIGFLN